MASPAPLRRPGHSPHPSHTLAPPPPLPNWSQTPTMPISMHAPGPLGLPEHEPFTPPKTRNGYLPAHGAESDDESDDGSDHYGRDEDEPWGGRRAASPAIAAFANTFNNIGNLVTSTMGRSPPATSHEPRRMPTDRELEMEAERAREASRLEAERILAFEKAQTAEETERQNMEAEVMRLLTTPTSATSPGPPTSAPSSPSKSPNPSWWNAAKQRLTPNKDGNDLTPSQMIVQDTRKLRKAPPSPAKEKALPSFFSPKQPRRDKSRERENEWPAEAGAKFEDPAFWNLNNSAMGDPGMMMMAEERHPRSAATTGHTVQRGFDTSPNADARSRAQSLPPPRTPQQQGAHLAAPVTPTHYPTHLGAPVTPQHRPQSLSNSPAPSMQSQQAPRSPYLCHTSSGALEVPESLVLMSGRLEKLERWTVAHVRALEDRMREVEEYIVGREQGWDGVEKQVGELRKGLEDLKGGGAKTTFKMGWRMVEDGDVNTRVTKNVERVVSVKDGHTESVVKEETVQVMARSEEKDDDEADRETLSGLAGTLNDYSKLFRGTDTPDVSRQNSMATHSIAESVSSESDQDEDVPKDVVGDKHDSTSAASLSSASDQPATPPSDLALPLPRAGSPLGFSMPLSTSPVGLPSPLDANALLNTPLVSRARLPRPEGDYVDSEDNSRAVSPSSALEPPAEEEPERVSPVGRKRYTTALSGRATTTPQSALHANKENNPVTPSPTKVHLPTPDTPTTATFTPARTHTMQHKAHSYSISSPPPAPAPFFSTTRPRPRPLSTYTPVSAQSPAPIQIPASHRRPTTFQERNGGVGLGFVDPLVVRQTGKGKPADVAKKTGREKVPVGQLVKFFDREM